MHATTEPVRDNGLLNATLLLPAQKPWVKDKSKLWETRQPIQDSCGFGDSERERSRIVQKTTIFGRSPKGTPDLVKLILSSGNHDTFFPSKPEILSESAGQVYFAGLSGFSSSTLLDGFKFASSSLPTYQSRPRVTRSR